MSLLVVEIIKKKLLLNRKQILRTVVCEKRTGLSVLTQQADIWVLRCGRSYEKSFLNPYMHSSFHTKCRLPLLTKKLSTRGKSVPTVHFRLLHKHIGKRSVMPTKKPLSWYVTLHEPACCFIINRSQEAQHLPCWSTERAAVYTQALFIYTAPWVSSCSGSPQQHTGSGTPTAELSFRF